MNNMIPGNITYDYATSETIECKFGFTDDKGREVGARVITVSVKYTKRSDGKSGYVFPEDQLGDWVELIVQPTRDGISFGASQMGTRHKTKADALKRSVEKVQATRKRYEKKFA